jgi:hypothetical protein
MFSAKCANPDCETLFDYRRGRMFRFRDHQWCEPANALRPVLVHFWLCDECSNAYTLDYVQGNVFLARISVSGIIR